MATLDTLAGVALVVVASLAFWPLMRAFLRFGGAIRDRDDGP